MLRHSMCSMVRPYHQQRVENVRYWRRCKGFKECGKAIRNYRNSDTAFYWKKHFLCRECFLQTELGESYIMVKGKVVLR